MRLESVPNAIEQAKAAAANMMGGEVIYDSLPWFWSDQYDAKLQTVGLLDEYDDAITRGDPDTNSFSVWYFKDSALLAVDAINDPRAFMLAKNLIANGVNPSQSNIENIAFDLKLLL